MTRFLFAELSGHYLQLPGGARLEVADAAQARLAGQLLRALGEGGAGC